MWASFKSRAGGGGGGGTDRAEPCDLLYLNRMFLSQENHTMAYFQIEPKVLCKPHPCPGLCFLLLAPPWTHSSLPDMVSVPGLCNFLASQSLYLLTPMPLGDSLPFHPILPRKYSCPPKTCPCPSCRWPRVLVSLSTPFSH